MDRLPHRAQRSPGSTAPSRSMGAVGRAAASRRYHGGVWPRESRRALSAVPAATQLSFVSFARGFSCKCLADRNATTGSIWASRHYALQRLDAAARLYGPDAPNVKVIRWVRRSRAGPMRTHVDRTPANRRHLHRYPRSESEDPVRQRSPRQYRLVPYRRAS